MRPAIPVIDIFSGPGGLSEGFSRYGAADWSAELSTPVADVPPLPSTPDIRFHIALSIEKDPTAHQTLLLRAFFRQFPADKAPEHYYAHLRGELSAADLFARHPEEHKRAKAEAWCATLGEVPEDELDRRIAAAVDGADAWCLIGGPPCQAYSLAGRSRNRGVEGYVPEDDDRHFLYREYLRIVARHAPPVFVMENVKGILSSSVEGGAIFETILDDLQTPGRRVKGLARPGLRYDVVPFLAPAPGIAPDDARRFILRAEELGVPQARHRVILFGIREDVRSQLGSVLPAIRRRMPAPVASVIADLPRVRACVTRDVGGEGWYRTIRASVGRPWFRELQRRQPDVARRVTGVCERIKLPRGGKGALFVATDAVPRYAPSWYRDDRLGGVCNHEARGHMAEDLERYLFAACYAAELGRSPTLPDYPEALLPQHGNAKKAIEEGGLFSDRFRVQVSTRPSTTITSHISKDGHYYIHPDPLQCRALTVREAARLQTFPDNYFFCGPRTQQFHQVGNAVPPLLAVQLAGAVASVLARGVNLPAENAHRSAV